MPGQLPLHGLYKQTFDSGRSTRFSNEGELVSKGIDLFRCGIFIFNLRNL